MAESLLYRLWVPYCPFFKLKDMVLAGTQAVGDVERKGWEWGCLLALELYLLPVSPL